MTNVRPEDLNYDHYEMEKYDQDIMRSIPGHKELHRKIDFILEGLATNRLVKVLELGPGTGITAERIFKKLGIVDYTAIDFSQTMLEGAKKRLSRYKVNFIHGDFAELAFKEGNDMVVSVIGIHHQEGHKGKKVLFKKVYHSLRKGGSFIFGDLVTHKSKHKAALADAYHYAYLVKNATDEKSLQEWAHHHKYLNDLAPLEDQVEWLRDVGFREVDVVFKKYNTALVHAKK